MPRIRTIKPEFFKHPGLSELPIAARYFFAGLWCQADRDGRLKDRPRLLKLEIVPWDDVDPESLLAQLASAGFILRYAVDGESYISIPHFAKHQRPHPREAKSEIPPPSRPGALRAVERNGVTRPSVEVNGEASPAPRTDPAVKVNGQACGSLDYGGTTGDLGSLGSGSLGSGEKAGGGSSEVSRPAVEVRGSVPVRAANPEKQQPPPPPIAPLPEKQNGQLVDFLRASWPKMEDPAASVAAWQEAWPGLNLLAEVKAARAKEIATHRQRNGDPGTYLHGWFKNAAADMAAGKPTATELAKGPQYPNAKRTREEADKRDLPWFEEKARKGDVDARGWLHKRWPDKFPAPEDPSWNEPTQQAAP
jgi:hypothetical protein